MAEAFALPFGGEAMARLAGRFHDLGKFSDEFQRYIESNSDVLRAEAEAEGRKVGAPGRRGSVDHTSAGANFAIQIAQKTPSTMADPVAFAVAGHHGGLRDPVDLHERLHRQQSKLAPLLANPQTDFLKADAFPPLPDFLAKALEEARKAGAKSAVDRFRRSIELFTRFLFSALCDADWLDTERFMDPEKSARRGSNFTIAELSAKLTAHIDELTEKSKAKDLRINQIRADIRSACQQGALRDRSVFTLTVPTGGGKTLAAMEFALRHAEQHGLRRVITALPFTSILEQSADVYRKAFDVALDDPTVLEHHASFDLENRLASRDGDDDDVNADDARLRLATENWDVPIVVTTTVQLLESLFANKPARCRKLHNVAGSVIVLDEVQTLPPHLLAATTEVLEELVQNYGCSIVLCSATQPALLKEQLKEAGFEKTIELMPDPIELSEKLRRVEGALLLR
jgi:CRISPR-associated endonuclease/helicase Cas3